MEERCSADVHIECDIRSDETWSGQYHCALHGIWFRSDSEPVLCPAGELYLEGYRDAYADANAKLKKIYEIFAPSKWDVD